MDIFSLNRYEKLDYYKKLPLIFTSLESSTCSVDGFLSGVNFNEDEIIDLLECRGNIVAIDCNYGHKVLDTYIAKMKERKSNRGRKKKVKIRKIRKYQGDGTAFNSQITFKTIGTHIRRQPLIVEPRKAEVIIEPLPDGMESITKPYKIKIFRNGSTTIPGILCEDLADIKAPLAEVCEYLSKKFLEHVQPLSLFSVMQNYKCKLLEGQISMKNLQSYCEHHFQTLLNTRFSDIVEFLSYPIFSLNGLSPLFDGWSDTLAALDPTDFYIFYPEMHRFLTESTSTKNLFVNFTMLTDLLDKLPLNKLYRTLQKFDQIRCRSYTVHPLPADAYRQIMHWLLHPYMTEMEYTLKQSRHNLLSHIKYDPEKYPGFLIKVKTPNIVSPEKKTTIKIFPSGKVNIDGANNRTEAEYIYYWLNSVLVETPSIIYSSSVQIISTDSEFSSDSEETD